MKLTPFHSKHAAAGAVFGPCGPWLAPTFYQATPTEEHIATRTRVTTTDFSTMCKFDFQGPDVLACLQKLLVNDVRKLRTGKALYSAMCNAGGEFVDDMTLYQLDEGHYMLIGGIPAREKDALWISSHIKEHGFQCYVTDITSALGLLSVAGPRSRELFHKLCQPECIDGLRFFEFCQVTIADCPCILSRTGVTGELGYEIIANAEDCPDIWDAIYAAGEEFGILPCGMAASGTLRMEKGYISGREFLDHSNPYEMGLGWSVALDTDFVGREALAKICHEGCKRSLCAVQLADKAVVAPVQASVLAGGKAIGKITSSAWLPTLDISYGMTILPVEYAKAGTNVQIAISETEIVEAAVVEKNLYDPSGSRIKG